MSETTIIGALCAWLEGSDVLDGATVAVDFLPERKPPKGRFFSVDTVPMTPVVKWNTDGSSIRQHGFVLRSVEDYDGDTLQSIMNCGLYERIAGWMEMQNRSGNLPVLPEGKTARNVVIELPGYLYNEHAGIGKYQIRGKLFYRQEKEM